MVSQQYVKIQTHCRVCNAEEMVPLFSLGNHFVNDFVEKNKVKAGVQCPIELVLCKKCTTVQLKHTAPQELLYSRQYWYRSSINNTMRESLREVVTWIESNVTLEAGDIVLDIGSNDGCLLRSYTTPWIVKVGVEPATNLAEEGSQGVDIFINDFWSYEAFLEGFIKSQDTLSMVNSILDGFVQPKAKVITALGMFYDMDDPNSFIKDVATALRDDGIFIAQLMCLNNMLKLNDIGNLCHEHLLFYSLESLRYMMGCHGLEIYDIETNNVNGQSYRLFIRKIGTMTGNGNKEISDALSAMYTLEHYNRLGDASTYDAFYLEMERCKRLVVELIKRVKAKKKSVWGYGASTKGNTILQYFELDHTMIDGIAERNREKWGLYTVGTGIPIYSEVHVRKQKPDYMLVLPYAFIEEFKKREIEWLKNGGKFIVPLPIPMVIGYDPGDNDYTEELIMFP